MLVVRTEIVGLLAGNFDSAHCIMCREEVSLEDVKAAVDAEQPCRCPVCKGLVKPDIVFFGESLPDHFFTRAAADFPAADLLIVMGTSLVVNPFASLIGTIFPLNFNQQNKCSPNFQVHEV